MSPADWANTESSPSSLDNSLYPDRLISRTPSRYPFDLIPYFDAIPNELSPISRICLAVISEVFAISVRIVEFPFNVLSESEKRLTIIAPTPKIEPICPIFEIISFNLSVVLEPEKPIACTSDLNSLNCSVASVKLFLSLILSNRAFKLSLSFNNPDDSLILLFFVRYVVSSFCRRCFLTS